MKFVTEQNVVYVNAEGVYAKVKGSIKVSKLF